jgi:hypothetical protein
MDERVPGASLPSFNFQPAGPGRNQHAPAVIIAPSIYIDRTKMPEVLPTAAYIITKAARRPDTAKHIEGLLRGKAIQVSAFQIWELLQSAQTIESVTRSVTDKFKIDRSVSHREVDELFKQLLQHDVVELSPDT